MARKRKARASKKEQRRQTALMAQRHLSAVLINADQHPETVIDSAAVHLVKTSRRHRLSLPVESKELVCRKCWSPLVSSSSFRVRIKDGQRIKTCLACGTVRRFGGGPKHHRRHHGRR